MDEFPVAGSANGPDEETLAQVVRIAGFTANLRRAVADYLAVGPPRAAAPRRRAKAATIAQRPPKPERPGRFRY